MPIRLLPGKALISGLRRIVSTLVSAPAVEAELVAGKGAVKLHLLLDHDGYLPTHAWIGEAAIHEVNIARKLELPPESIIAMDMGFTDYRMYGRWTERRLGS